MLPTATAMTASQEERNNAEALTAAVTEALQMWLQPLRDYAKRPIVADFRYLLDAGRVQATSASSSTAN